MRTIVHLSDLHFGRVDDALAASLVQQVRALAPHVVVVSGDLTQRARTHEFAQARAFLASLPQPQVVVPGNHDVPAYNLLRRIFEPLGKYRRNLSDDLLPEYVDDEVAVFGLNSTLSFTTKHGRLRERDIALVCGQLRDLGPSVVRIVVCHHPFDLPQDHTPSELIGSAMGAMRAFAESGVDVFLSGHLHLSHTSLTAERYRIPGHSALIVQAGTAISSRSRGEPNSFNVLRVDGFRLTVERWAFDAAATSYAVLKTEAFARGAEGWAPA